VLPPAEHVPTTSTTVVDSPSPTPTTTNQDRGEAIVEGEVASRQEPPREYKWITQLQGSSATLMNVLHGRGFETILISLMLHLLPPLSPKILDTHYLIIIGLIRCMRSWRTLRGIRFGSW
jgi:hypothetical protein